MNSAALAPCFHCGLPAPAGTPLQAVVLGQPRRFCCAGCQAVAETIVASGLEDYYRDRDKIADAPALVPAALQSLHAWDHPAAQQGVVAHDGERAGAELTLENLNCAACAWLIEKRLQQEDGVLQAALNLSTHRLHLEWSNNITSLGELLTVLAGIGYRAHPYRSDAHAQQMRQESRTLLKRLAVAGFGMMQVMMYAGALYVGAWSGIEAEYRDYLNWVSLLITAPVFLYSGQPFFRSAWAALKTRQLNMDVPVTLALVSAFAASVYATLMRSGTTYYDSVTMFIFFLLTSHYLETRARQKAGDTVANLMALAPPLATRLEADGQQHLVAVADLAVDDRIVVTPGETVPADGVVVAGASAVSEALLTGEPLPVAKKAGDSVIGGSVNSDGALELRVTRTAPDSMLGALNRLLNRALAEKPQLARRADRIAQVFVGIVLVFSTLVFTAWLYRDGLGQAFWVTLAVLVATCPCALSLATPVALTSATSALAERGFLISRGHVLETLAAATHIVFDKTGTLTTGELQLEDSTVLQGDRDAALRLVCALEQHSGHPVARAFRGLRLSGLPDVQDLQQETGAGVAGEIAGRRYRFGHADFALGSASPADRDLLWLANDDGAIASFRLTDTLRPEALRVIEQLQRRGLETWLLSGDPSRTPYAMGEMLGMQQVCGGLSPEQKRAKVQELQASGAVVVMVGDGVNDAPVLAQAHLSVAMASGTDLAQLTADSLLLRDDLRMLVAARDLARRSGRVIRQNLGWALAYNLSVLPLAAIGALPPWAAALGMSLSSLVVVGNALRLRLVPRQQQEAF